MADTPANLAVLDGDARPVQPPSRGLVDLAKETYDGCAAHGMHHMGLAEWGESY